MPPSLQIALGVGGLCVAVFGVLLNLVLLNRQKATLIYDLRQEVAVLKTRMDAFAFVSEKWLASMLHAPTHYRLDDLLEKFVSQQPFTEGEYDALERLLEEQGREPERFTGQHVAAGLLLAFVIQRRRLEYPVQPGHEEPQQPWSTRLWRWFTPA